MSIFRRRPDQDDQTTQPAPAPQRPSTESISAPAAPTPSRPPMPAPSPIPHHVERALLAMTSKMQSVLERLDDLDRRIEDLTEAVAGVPSHSDVLEVRLHSAKLAAELARATIELRGEIGMASDEARRAARLARSDDEATDSHFALPVDLDLPAQDLDQLPSVSNKGNWTRSA